MASKAGMQGFVAERNADARAANPDLNDLKIQKPSAKADKKQKSKRSTNNLREREQSVRPDRLHENASLRSTSADTLSTTASTTRPRNGEDYRLHTRSQVYDRNVTNGDDQPFAFGGTDYDEVPENDQEPQHDSAAENKYQLMLAQAKGRGAAGSPTIGQIHLKGDSYPPTSAGVPSVADQHDRSDVRAPGGIHNLPTHAAERTSFGRHAQRQQPQPVSSRHQVVTTSQRHTQGQQAASFHQPPDIKSIDPEPGSDFDAAAGFTFGQVPTARKEITVNASRLQNQAPKQRPSVAEVKAPAHRSHHVEPEKQEVQLPIADNNGRTAILDRHAFQQPEQAPPPIKNTNYLHSRNTHELQHQMAAQDPPSDAFMEEDPAEQLEPQKHHEHQLEGQFEEQLDYDPPELFTKDYQSLKAELFDQHPNAQPFAIPGMPDTATLADKMMSIAGAEPSMQGEFFASLNIDEWEEAGDWFLERFGDTIKALKNVRREKRKAARALEDEIEQRETHVSKKRHLTNVAMSGMKSSGAAVLHGTPGKKR
jgi:hypothetical protein